MRKYMRGITLTELMIVVVIIGILATVAYPNYREFVARAKRTEAKSMLLQVASMQERFYLQNNSYTTNLTSLGFATTPNQVSDSGSYRLTVTAAGPNDFTAQVVYLNADAEAGKCATFQIDGRGTKTSAPLADCWSRTR
jgi:type IV pilus assembly protein PilE